MRSRVAITLGYSFRDERVTDAIRVWANNPSIATKKLIVGIAPGGSVLPDSVTAMDVAEQLQITPITSSASEMIGAIFPDLSYSPLPNLGTRVPHTPSVDTW